LQAVTSPPDLQDPSINYATALSLSNLIMAILFLKKGKPITQAQGYWDLLLTPSVTLKAQLFNSCSYSQANPSTSKPHLTPAKTRAPFHLSAEMEEAFSCSCRDKAVASIRSLYIRTTLHGQRNRSLELSSFAPSAESSLSSSTSALNCPPEILSFVSQITERMHREILLNCN